MRIPPQLAPGFILTMMACAGCASDTPMNPTFAVTRSEARAALDQMHRDKVSLQRPVLVLGGIHDPGFVSARIADVVRDSVPDRQRVIRAAFFETWSFDTCADKAIRTLEKHFPSDDLTRTIEVDVIGFSMGGVIARYAASDLYAQRTGRRLTIARLFTISSPHRGATLAHLPTFDQRAKDMRRDSTLLTALNTEYQQHAMYPIFCYVRLDDAIVGEHNASLPGIEPWWVPSGWEWSHTFAGHDVRILADILRRLRYEEPLTTEPPAPLPK